jgi:hypothetical protein
MTAGVNRGYDGVPEGHADVTEHRRMMARAINRLNGGKLNCTLDVTLRPSQTTTPIADPRLAATSFIAWMPQTANAGAAMAAGLYVTGRTKGAAVLNHASSTATDQAFTLLILG